MTKCRQKSVRLLLLVLCGFVLGFTGCSKECEYSCELSGYRETTDDECDDDYLAYLQYVFLDPTCDSDEQDVFPGF